MFEVATFEDFNLGNDPHGEHDRASFEMYGQQWRFTFDYYARPDEWAGKMPAAANAPALEFGSENASDVVKTVRVLTIMSADEN